jgi:hypothetical protein
MLRRKSQNCRDFHRISTLRATAPQEAWLAVEKGPYLLGFSQLAGDWQNRRHTSDARARHVKKAPFAGIYGANRDRTGDLLLAKQALSQLSYGPKASESRGSAARPNAKPELLVEVEVPWRALLEPEPLLLGRIAQELGRLLEHVLG